MPMIVTYPNRDDSRIISARLLSVAGRRRPIPSPHRPFMSAGNYRSRYPHPWRSGWQKYFQWQRRLTRPGYVFDSACRIWASPNSRTRFLPLRPSWRHDRYGTDREQLGFHDM